MVEVKVPNISVNPEIVEKVSRIAVKHGVEQVWVFGSVARGDAGYDSDLDLLIKLPRGKTLIDLIAFEEEVEEVLNMKVDVVTLGSLRREMKERIRLECVKIFG